MGRFIGWVIEINTFYVMIAFVVRFRLWVFGGACLLLVALRPRYTKVLVEIEPRYIKVSAKTSPHNTWWLLLSLFVAKATANE